MKDIPLSKQKAVALKYPEDAEAPFVIANGKGLLAKRILEEARKNDIKNSVLFYTFSIYYNISDNRLQDKHHKKIPQIFLINLRDF